MACLSSPVGSMVRLQALMHGQHASFLRILVLVTVIAADSPVADDSLWDSTHPPVRFIENIPTPRGSSPSALPDSQSTAFERSESPGALSSISGPNHEAWTILSPPEPFPGTNSQLEELTKRSTNWNMARRSSVHQPTSLPLLPTGSKQRSHLNISSTSLSPSVFTGSTLDVPLRSEGKDTSSKQQDVASEKTPPAMALKLGQPLEPSKLIFSESSSQIVDINQVRPSQLLLGESKPVDDINMLLNPDEIQFFGYNVPFATLHHTSPLSEPTEVSPEDLYPTNTMEVDWGSGDYLETMSFFNPDGDGYSLVSKVPVPYDAYDLEDHTESYDTSFPSRVGISASSLHHLYISPSPSIMTTHSTHVPHKSLYPSSFSSTAQLSLEPAPTPNTDVPDESYIEWAESFTIQPTDVLLPDMNSLEYYTTQLTKERNGSEIGAEHNFTVLSSNNTEITPTIGFPSDSSLTEYESSSDLSGLQPHDESSTTETPHLVNVSDSFLDPSLVPSHVFDLSSSTWGGQVTATKTPTVHMNSTELTEAVQPSATPLLPEDVTSSSSLTDVHWFVTESFPESTTLAAPVLTSTLAFSVIPTEPTANNTPGTTEITSQPPISTTEQTLNMTSVSTSRNVTLLPPVMLGDQGVTEDESDSLATMTSIPASSDVYTVSAAPTSIPATTPSTQATTGTTVTTEPSTKVNITSTITDKTTTTPTASRRYLCELGRPAYLTKIGFPSGATVGYAKSQVKDVLKKEFNKSVELQVVDPPPKFVFRVVSGPVVYTAISVINALRRSGRRFMYMFPSWMTPDHEYQVHTVLQFVPKHIDVRYCNFSEHIEKGLTMAFAEVRRRSGESTNFTVHIVNITMATPKYEERQLRQPVDITFTVSGSRGYLMGSEVSTALRKLTMVEFSYYTGFPVLQIAEPFHYPELNTSHLLRSSWVRTVLLGVIDQKVGERTFQANLERRVAMLLGEAMGLVRRVRRATTLGNNSIQVVSVSRMTGVDHPLELVYFAEDPSGGRMPAVRTANLLNSLDVQRAAIVLGYRVQGILAQPVEKVASSPSDAENTNMWIIVGVVIPLLVVIVIISILYWKLCRTDKLEFQPDAMTVIQQRQKLQTSSVKGFDFAKLHLGQQNKDDVMVIQEPVPPGPASGPLPVSISDGFNPSENGEIPTPRSKTSGSSTKASRSGRRRERISPSDGDSVVSDHSSERGSTEENLRAHATPSDSKQTRKNRIGPPPMNGGINEQLSSASIFEHVDRMPRGTEASRRLPNKVQLIAMQPMPIPPLHSPPINGKVSNTNQINKEIQVALRHKSEIEHHRNKIRLRAKRKGHYDFPAMDDVISGFGDAKEQDRIYQKAKTQIDKILDPEAQMPSIFMESKKSGRGRRSPKQRLKDQLNGGMMEADKDHLITEDNDAAYRKCPGVNNVAYVSDPDQGPGSPQRSPSPTDDVFLGPACSPPGHAPPPPPYMLQQPSIEEARQQMHSLLDDAFALVSPTTQGSTAGVTLPGVNTNPLASSPPGRGPRAWGPSYQGLGPLPGRFTDLGISSAAVQCLTPRQGLGSNYLPTGETAEHGEQLQPESLYASRGLYADELPSTARPRPVGGTTGAQLHHLTQVGLSSRMNGYPAGVRAAPGQNGALGWNHYHDDNFSRVEPEKDPMHRSEIREPISPSGHLDTAGVGYLSALQPQDTSPPSHSSASLIKAIREELLRLSQKQAAVPSYRS
ncbi:UPF0606 protein KIAA1549 isoform X6 [Cololabis saira]|uniref:UPF0606 protein KIAA1549 isoform X6 n=1 Tax=Cololabis saira TaxID=129043 RepID=UPI002AD3B9BF|nr:UPF0606 protein KIAA1549 isoform X6 [Cololabis saira]